MQPSNFDELTKALATSTSRRHALRLIATASIGGLFGLGGIRMAFGKNSPCHRNGTACSANQKCCSNYCVKGKCTCPPVPTCNSVCPCPSGQTCVNGTCCPTANVCGSSCGCPTGQVCLNDQCAPCITAGNSCNASIECCSNNCCLGLCCDSDRICLSNGTCAKPCEAPGGCGNSCGCYITRQICGTLGNGGSCTIDDDCPRGQWCNYDTQECFAANC
jgi:hypothetical protein